MIKFYVNTKLTQLDVDPGTPLLWALREQLKLTGTKFGCGIAQCGACTVHLDGRPIRSCITPVSSIEGKSVTTIEGLADHNGSLNEVQQAWIEHQVPQCGYCQSGQIMTATALIAANPNPSDEEIDGAMSGNICRCGMYSRIKSAIKSVASNTEELIDSRPQQESPNEV